MKIKSLRQQIDQVDRHLLNLLNKRTKLAGRIGRLKYEQGHPVFSKKREADLLRKLQKMNPGPLLASELRALYAVILSISKASQRRDISSLKKISTQRKKRS